MPSFRTRGFAIHYEVHGDGAGLPLVLVMGMGGTCQGWLSVTVPDLVKSGRIAMKRESELTPAPVAAGVGK